MKFQTFLAIARGKKGEGRMCLKIVCGILLTLLIVGMLSPCFVVLAALFSPGDTVQVINCTVVGKPLRVRSSPSLSGGIIGSKSDGDRGMILTGPQSADGYNWWKVRWPDNLEGWSAEGDASDYYLTKVTIPPSTKFSIGDPVTVYGTGAYGLNVRTDPPYLTDTGTNVYDGKTGTVVGGPFYGIAISTYTPGFYHFWKINYGTITGWSAQEWLVEVPTYYADIYAHCNTNGADVGVAISMDGSSTGYVTPHRFTGLTGTHNFAVPGVDGSGHPFKNWNTGLASTTIPVSSTGTYTAYYQATVVTKTLSVYSSPSGVSFTANGASHSTPWSGSYSQGTSVSLEMPYSYIPSGDAMYFWQEWSDGITSESRAVLINSDTTLTGIYEGPYYILTISSSPASGIPFTLGGATQMTQYNGILFQGYYTVEMPATYGDYVWQQWLEDGDTNRIRTVSLAHSISLTAVYSTDLDFSITALPMSLTVPKGGDSSSAITVSSINGFNGVVGLYCSGRPTGVWSAFVPEVVVPPAGGSATSALFITADWTAEPGDYSITVTGTCGTLTHDIPIALHIAADPPTCFVELKKDGAAIGDIDVGGFFDIYVGDSTDNLGIEYVRFLSDDMQNGNPTGEWTEWYDWDFPYGDWDASAKTMRWSFATPGRKEVWAEVRDDALEKDKCSSNIYVKSGLPPIEKLVRVFNRPYMPIAELAVTYEWFDDYYGIYDIYDLSEIHIRLVGFTGRYTVFIRDSNKNAIWSNSGWSGANLDTSYSFEDSPLTVRDYYEIGISLQGVDDIAGLVKPFLKFTDWYIKAFEKLVAGPYSILIPHSMLMEMFKPEEVKYWDQTPIAVGKTSTTQFYPDSPEASEPLETSDLFLAHIFSPVELRVYDSEGRVTGMVGGQVKEEIPDSVYFNDTVVVLAPNSSYVYEIVGAEHGSYGLIVASILEDGNTTFVAVDIPTSFNATHQYMIDWAALSLGNEGVTVEVDSDGNGVPEYTFASDSELTQSEFLVQTSAGPRIYLDPSANAYTNDTAHVGTRFNVTVWIENVPNFGGAQVCIEFNDTIVRVVRWFEPRNDPQYVFYGRGTSALPTPPNDVNYQHLGPNRGRALVSISLFPPNPPYFTGSGKICIFEFNITSVPTELGKFTSGLIINPGETFLLNGDTGGEISATKENGSYEISKELTPPETFALTITATTGGSTNPAVGPHDYLEGTVVSVQAFNNSGYVFDHWELDGIKIGSDNPVDVTVDGSHTLRAVFKAYGNQGDITGPDGVPDGRVDLRDVFLASSAYGSHGPDYLYPGSSPHPKWNEKCDLNGDNKVDLKDLYIVWKNYGKEYT